MKYKGIQPLYQPVLLFDSILFSQNPNKQRRSLSLLITHFPTQGGIKHSP